MKYCIKCGRQLPDDGKICSICAGGEHNQQQQQQQSNQYRQQNNQYQQQSYRYQQQGNSDVYRNTNGLLIKLSERLKINGIIWIVIAALQILIGIFGFYWILIVGVLNIVSAIKDIQYSKTILTNQNGIVKNFEPLTRAVITLAYNILIGGIVGVFGSIYYFIAIRGFVMENKNEFYAMETGA